MAEWGWIAAGTAILVAASGVVWWRARSAAAARAALVGPVDAATGKRRAVVITGCDTGFGHALTELLAQQGFLVFAACLTEQGFAHWREHSCDGKVVAVQADVTSDTAVQNMVFTVTNRLQSEPADLWAVVNNAGIADGFILEWTEVATWERVMQVNYLGAVRVTRAFVQLLLRNPGSRVVAVSSAAAGFPSAGGGPYAASKAALNTFCDTIRLELEPWGVYTSVMEPTFHRTPLLSHGRERLVALFEAQSADVKARYGRPWVDQCCSLYDALLTTAAPANHVVDELAVLVRSTVPPLRKHVGRHGVALAVLRAVPLWMRHGLMSWMQRRGTPLPAALAMRRRV